jgi:hypothetical protein
VQPLDNEHYYLEYKAGFPPKNALKAEIVSFLNSRTGGTIYLGIHDDGSAVEFPSLEARRKTYQEWEEKLANWITNAFSPDVIGLIFVDPTTEAFTIRVSAGVNKPYYYTDGAGLNPKGIWIRVGSTKRRASDERSKRKAQPNHGQGARQDGIYRELYFGNSAHT